MADKEYLTVSEFAEKASVTSQAVYKRMQGNLKPFVKEIKGKKYIHHSALNVMIPSETTNHVENAEIPQSTVEHIETLKRTVELLTSQIVVKDKQINDLNDRLQQSLTNASMNHYVQAKSIEAPGVKRSWLEKIFNK